MKKILSSLFSLICMLGASTATLIAADAPPSLLAPLPVRDEFLLSSGYLALSPSSTEILSKGQWGLELRFSSANTFAVSRKISKALSSQRRQSAWRVDGVRSYSGDVFVIDGEIQRATVAIRYGVARGEFFVSIPVLSTGNDRSDEIIEKFHSEFGLGTDGRSAIPRDRRFVYMKSGQRELFRTGAGQIGLGDVTLGAKYSLPSVGGTVLAVEALTELPTGNEKMMFGSGSIDAAVNLLASHRSDRSATFAATGVTRLGKNGVLGVPDRTIVTTSFGYSRVIAREASATIQITTANSPFRGLGWPELAQRSYQLSVGVQRQVDSGQVLHLALIENALHYENSADFGFEFGLSMIRP